VSLISSKPISASLFSDSDIDRYRLSSDASHFQLIPEQIATPQSPGDIAEIFHFAHRTKTSVTFRSGGTSLSGQAVSDAILVDTRRNFRRIEVLDNGALVRVEPGANVRAVNTALARYGKKLGPDPASEIACTIGGVIANNSSGMACGITDNAYRTLQSVIVTLANGTTINTADPDSESQLRRAAPELVRDIESIKAEIQSNPDLVSQISTHYKIKNTMGYGLNSFIDFDSVIDIFMHLLVGSEGTLGFISSAVFHTVPLLTKAATTLLVFENIQTATEALAPLIETKPQVIELLDAASLRVSKIDLGELQIIDHCALLVEYQSETNESLASTTANADSTINTLALSYRTQLSTEQAFRDQVWKVRKGLYAAVAGARRSGTTALLEDIAVPVEKLADTCLKLRSLFAQYGYHDAVIFGHAKDGNLHFLINENFQDATSRSRYQKFTEDMVNLVLEQGGSLKAEHGTGRMMAPFVERQYGPTLYNFMVRIKQAFDPAGILNPGVVISDDALAHMRNIKINPTIHKIADNCVECGYCEPICPSKNLTTTPRQRIVLQRAIAKATLDSNASLAKSLISSSKYHVEETCAVDGLCQTSCPVGINTGSLVQDLRAKRNSPFKNFAWKLAANNWSLFTSMASTSLSLAGKLPTPFVKPTNNLARSIFGDENVTLWNDHLPQGGSKRISSSVDNPDFIYFSSCLNSLFESETSMALISLSKKAGLSYSTPQNISNLCCSTPWSSKGIQTGQESMAKQTFNALWKASDGGRIPVVSDNSSCTEGLINAMTALNTVDGTKLVIIDSIEFTAQNILPKLSVHEKVQSAAVHPTCSSTTLGLQRSLASIAESLATEVTIPQNWGCCAYAGDRGILHPELTSSATFAEANEISQGNFDLFLSTNRTCEIGMSHATGADFEHILCALNRMSSAGA